MPESGELSSEHKVISKNKKKKAGKIKNTKTKTAEKLKHRPIRYSNATEIKVFTQLRCIIGGKLRRTNRLFKSWDIETSGSLCLIFYQFDHPIRFLNVYSNLSPKDCICIQLNFILNYISCEIQLQRAPHSAEICIRRKNVMVVAQKTRIFSRKEGWSPVWDY